jgi:oligopeptide/dipeptide ABC transporter ATP-binding protein
VSESPLLAVRGLSVTFAREGHARKVVDGVSFEVRSGETVAVVGESGSGKSVTSLAILRLLGDAARVEADALHFEGRDVLAMDDRALRALRGRQVAMIFQDPMTSLDPVMRVGDQVAEAIALHEALGRRDLEARVHEALGAVGFPDPKAGAMRFPHELSGGLRQRVLIAIAIAARPKLVLADEPTTALDPTLQAQVLDLLDRLRAERGLSLVLVTHDLGVVAQRADRVVVLYAGQVVESGPTAALFREPKHPYTRALLAARPELGAASRGNSRLRAIPGLVPPPEAWPAGCRFAARCHQAKATCHDAPGPALVTLEAERVARCPHPQEPLP